MKRSILRRNTARPGVDAEECQVGKSFNGFVAEKVAKSGRSKTAVALDATRGKALGADLDRIAGTSLDKGSELDALAAMRRRTDRPS
jgi:hypothetical protein